MEEGRLPVVAWLHLEDREEYGDTYLDGSPIAHTREVWKSVAVGPWRHGPESLSLSVPLTEPEARRLLDMTADEFVDAVYAHLRVGSREPLPGLPKGPYFDLVDVYSLRTSLQAALMADERMLRVAKDLRDEAARRRCVIALRESIVETVRVEFRRDPKILNRIDPRDFERLVAELLESMGYEVELTPQTRDGGRDILARATLRPSKPLLYIVECKRWHEDRRIDVGDVRQFLYVVREHDRASGGMFVTTAYFTSGARVLEQQWEYLLSLHDRDALASWLESYGTWHQDDESRIWVPQ
jgi:hypothetical protein